MCFWILKIWGGKTHPNLFYINLNNYLYTSRASYSTNCTKKQCANKLDPYYITGFTDGEGCFLFLYLNIAGC